MRGGEGGGAFGSAGHSIRGRPPPPPPPPPPRPPPPGLCVQLDQPPPPPNPTTIAGATTGRPGLECSRHPMKRHVAHRHVTDCKATAARHR
jgi:hypothetical protein